MTAESDQLARQLGDVVGDGYVIERALGAGGFAVVFLVRDVTLKRNLAVKVLSPDIITSRAVLDRFRREAEVIAQLSHPNIVPLYFLGQRDDLLYLAMQCLDGGSVADRLARDGTMPVADVVRVTKELASALAHAHKRGIIHRDIKPANILFDAESGRCLLTDFGIARTEAGEKLTATGLMLGSPAYLSPEQITGEQTDHRVDIYALGVTMFEMLAGRLPFEGASPSAAMMKRLGGAPDAVTTLRSDVPRQLSDVIARCLAMNPDERFQNASELADALDGSVTWPTRAAPRSKLPRALGAIAATVLVAVASAWLLQRARTTARVAPPVSVSAPGDSLVAIPAGVYAIGETRAPQLARPRHELKIAAFRIERTEVTVGSYERFIKATLAPVPWAGATPFSGLPVTGVAWGDAANYCVWRFPNGGRLPTEVEWEAAARGRAGRIFPYGDEPQPSNANTLSAQRRAVAPVGSFPRGATPEGLQDMSGNAWEWTSSEPLAYPGGTGTPDSASNYRVIRGGAFDTADSLATGWVRGYARVMARPGDLNNTGFRCVVGEGK